MARIRIETLARPEEELSATQSSAVVGAGPFYYGLPYGGYAYNGYRPIVAAPITPYGFGFQPGFVAGFGYGGVPAPYVAGYSSFGGYYTPGVVYSTW